MNDNTIDTIGISTLTWPERPLADAIRRAHELEFTSVDLGILQWSALHTPRLTADENAALAPIEAALEETGIRVASFNARLEGDRHEQRAQAAALARAAQRLGVASGITLGHGKVDEPLAEVVAGLRETCAILADHGVTPMVESHRNNFTQHIDQALALLEALPQLGFTLDASHYISQGLQPADWEPLLSRTRHAHLRPCTDHELSVASAEAGPQTSAWLRQLAAHGYRGTLSFEVIRDETETLAFRERLQEETVRG